MKSLFGLFILLSSFSVQAYHSTLQQVDRDNYVEVTMSFDVGSQAKADILFIIDDSGSMSTHQNTLEKNLQGMIQTLYAYNDINAAVITTTAQSNTFVSVGGNGKFVGPVLNSQDKNFILQLSKQVNVGTNGDAIEKPLEATFLALSEPLMSGHNKDFLRPTADLILFYLTDTYDQGKVSSQDLYNHIVSLKPQNRVLALAALPQDYKNCPNEMGTKPPTGYNTHIEDFVQMTNGKVFDLCGDYTKSMEGIMNDAQVAMSDIVLNVFPNTTIDSKTIVVKVDGVPLVAGDIINGWIYNPSTLTISLGLNAISQKSSQLTVSYQLKK